MFQFKTDIPIFNVPTAAVVPSSLRNFNTQISILYTSYCCC
jgi:hypothetical protein